MKKKMLGIAIGMAAVFAMTGCSGQAGEETTTAAQTAAGTTAAGTTAGAETAENLQIGRAHV